MENGLAIVMDNQIRTQAPNKVRSASLTKNGMR